MRKAIENIQHPVMLKNYYHYYYCSLRIIISTNKENNRLIKADISMAALLSAVYSVCLLFTNDGQRNTFSPQSIVKPNRWQIHTVCGRNDMQHTTDGTSHSVHHHHFIHIYHHSVDKLLMFNKLLAIRLTQSTHSPSLSLVRSNFDDIVISLPAKMLLSTV